ncbi:PAS domain S-box-containing protein [Archangium gephyra]|uniref:histidine kinase n=1 Tax=Archangium gephyra TaxID=48 RepID=A0AAC8QJE4_9BACT|nr:ATP-binding protein [Archangium gephyra]AKJ08286.1 Histidine protein kinase AsgD [Archangium gephyra]REG14236.1 PAS domain S-box-containing protein [Archangium gephyra]
MMPEPPEARRLQRVLVVDDSPSDRLMAVRALTRAFRGLHVEQVGEEEQWHQVLELPRFDAVIVDYQLHWATGLELLHTLQQRWPGVPVIMLTGTAEEWQALEAVQEGLEEYLPKTPDSYTHLPRTLRFALERARQRQALRESTEMLRLVIEGVYGHAIFLVDPHRRIVSWNTGAQAITGYSEAEVMGQPVAALLVPEEQRGEPLERQMEELRRRGVYTGEGWRLRKDGSRFWADITVSALYEEGGALRGYAVVLRDATERKRVEEERRRAEEFRERLLGIVSHDLRSPLQAISLQSQLLARRVRTEVVETATARIFQSAERMTRMIADLLDFTRGRLGGGIPVEREPGDLFAFTYEVLEELRMTTLQSRISTQATGDGRGEWDRDRLTQVVQNLVSNALKHGEKGTPLRVVMEGEGETVVLCIQNQGTPIPPELVPHLFDPFRRGRGESANDALTGGLGLGLYIVQEIVHAHDGTITVTSDERTGTMFTLRLPRHALTPRGRGG